MSLWPWTRIRELERERNVFRMKWRRADARLDAAHALYRDLLDTNHNLVRQIIELKRDGFNPPPAAQQVQPEPEMDQRVLQALLSRAKPGSDLYREMFNDALTMLQAGRDAEEVANEIYEGGAE